MSTYQLAQPPRDVPWPIRVRVWFGGALSQFGWLFFGFGMIFCWVFGLLADVGSVAFLAGRLDTAPGVISDITGTGASENEQPVFANHFVFRVEREETEYRGVSYTTGRRFSVGDEVTVEYLRRDPAWSRIEGTRTGEFSVWVLCFVSIFPLVGLSFILNGFFRGITGSRLLIHGNVAEGRLIRKEPTNTRINKKTVYKLTFEFTANDGQRYEAVAKNHLTYPLEDEEQEQIVYDPANPRRAVLVDNLPGDPDIDEWGHITLTKPGSSLAVLILPALTLMIHGGVLLFVLVR